MSSCDVIVQGLAYPTNSSNKCHWVDIRSFKKTCSAEKHMKRCVKERRNTESYAYKKFRIVVRTQEIFCTSDEFEYKSFGKK